MEYILIAVEEHSGGCATTKGYLLYPSFLQGTTYSRLIVVSKKKGEQNMIASSGRVIRRPTSSSSNAAPAPVTRG
jgi:hypothetical protein